MRVNWGIASSYAPGDFPLPHIRQMAREHLLRLLLERPQTFSEFADAFIEDIGLVWPGEDRQSGTSILRGVVELTLAQPLGDFGVLHLSYEPHPTWGPRFRALETLMLTALGKKLLEGVGE